MFEERRQGKQEVRDTLYGVDEPAARQRPAVDRCWPLRQPLRKLQVTESYPPLTWDLAALIGAFGQPGALARRSRRRARVRLFAALRASSRACAAMTSRSCASAHGLSSTRSRR